LTKDDLRHRPVRPLRICLVNLMPNKIVTEAQFCRLLGGTPIAVDATLCVPDSYRSKSTPAAHLAAFYQPWSAIRHQAFDGLVVTGAPIETLPFEDVTYWSNLRAIFDWAKANIASSLYICWAAQAALHHFMPCPSIRCGKSCPASISTARAAAILACSRASERHFRYRCPGTRKFAPPICLMVRA
jgi:homoserine O-succinyltransferase/O-acetyltransferase